MRNGASRPTDLLKNHLPLSFVMMRMIVAKISRLFSVPLLLPFLAHSEASTDGFGRVGGYPRDYAAPSSFVQTKVSIVRIAWLYVKSRKLCIVRKARLVWLRCSTFPPLKLNPSPTHLDALHENSPDPPKNYTFLPHHQPQ